MLNNDRISKYDKIHTGRIAQFCAAVKVGIDHYRFLRHERSVVTDAIDSALKLEAIKAPEIPILNEYGKLIPTDSPRYIGDLRSAREIRF
jgi:hypothetical protein